MKGQDRAPGEAVTEESLPVDPWARFGWLLGAVWLVFLAFPLGAAVTIDRPVALRVVAVALILLFAGVYVRAMWLDDQPTGQDGRFAYPYLAVMLGLALATVPLIGANAFGLVPFLLSLAGIALPVRQALAALALALTVLVAVALAQGSLADWWFFLIIYPMVTATLVIIRLLEGGSSRQREARRLLEIAGERDRVARDVHDVLGHSLTVITVKAELAERLVDLDPERAKAEIAEVRSLSRQALAEIRATVAGLRVARLGDERDAAAMALSGAGIESDLPEDVSVVDPRHRITLAWALRETVTNVVRHSHARRCTVELGPDWLSVTDDGRGLRGSREGNGIRGLRERVESVGGSVSYVPVESGTCVRVQLPSADAGAPPEPATTKGATP